jgi:hypothetical protein
VAEEEVVAAQSIQERVEPLLWAAEVPQPEVQRGVALD